MTQKTFNVGDRVRVRRIRTREGTEHGGWTGTVVALARALGGPETIPHGLFGVLRDDDGVLHGIAPEGLELCGDGKPQDGLRISVARLHQKRRALFEDMVRVVATARNADISDPRVMRKVESYVFKISGSWSSADEVVTTKTGKKTLGSWSNADGAQLRRAEFKDQPELRSRLVAQLARYLDLGELLEQLSELIDGDPSDAADAGELPVIACKEVL